MLPVSWNNVTNKGNKFISWRLYLSCGDYLLKQCCVARHSKCCQTRIIWQKKTFYGNDQINSKCFAYYKTINAQYTDTHAQIYNHTHTNTYTYRPTYTCTLENNTFSNFQSLHVTMRHSCVRSCMCVCVCVCVTISYPPCVCVLTSQFPFLVSPPPPRPPQHKVECLQAKFFITKSWSFIIFVPALWLFIGQVQFSIYLSIENLTLNTGLKTSYSCSRVFVE